MSRLPEKIGGDLRAAAIGVTLVLMLHIVSAALQSRLLQPGENLTVLLPRGPVGFTAARGRGGEVFREQ